MAAAARPAAHGRSSRRTVDGSPRGSGSDTYAATGPRVDDHAADAAQPAAEARARNAAFIPPPYVVGCAGHCLLAGVVKAWWHEAEVLQQ